MAKHDHRRSIWIIADGRLLWCYRCGAWRVNDPVGEWYRPTGEDGPNPAMKKKKDGLTQFVRRDGDG